MDEDNPTFAQDRLKALNAAMSVNVPNAFRQCGILPQFLVDQGNGRSSNRCSAGRLIGPPPPRLCRTMLGFFLSYLRFQPRSPQNIKIGQDQGEPALNHRQADPAGLYERFGSRRLLSSTAQDISPMSAHPLMLSKQENDNPGGGDAKAA